MAAIASGDHIEAYCHECEQVLGHLIHAVDGENPERVECKA